MCVFTRALAHYSGIREDTCKPLNWCAFKKYFSGLEIHHHRRLLCDLLRYHFLSKHSGRVSANERSPFPEQTAGVLRTTKRGRVSGVRDTGNLTSTITHLSSCLPGLFVVWLLCNLWILHKNRHRITSSSPSLTNTHTRTYTHARTHMLSSLQTRCTFDWGQRCLGVTMEHTPDGSICRLYQGAAPELQSAVDHDSYISVY